MKLISVTIKGTTAMLQHRFNENNEVEPSTRKVLVSHGLPREQAEKSVYRAKDGSFYFPGSYIARMLREAGSGHKLRGSRKSVKYVIPAAVLVVDDAIPLLNGDGASKIKDFECDSRPVTIPATRGKIMRHRPRFDQWSAKFAIRINETILPVDFIQMVLAEGGLQVGIGDFRPSSGGPFGTFQIVEWKEQK